MVVKMEEPLVILVCNNCGQRCIGVDIKTKEKTCIICGHTVFKSVVVPDKMKCIYCKKEWKTKDILKTWIDIPFYDNETNMFYDGCRGWD